MLKNRLNRAALILAAFLASGASAALAQSETKPWARIQTNLYSCKSAEVNAQMKALAEARDWGAMRKLAGENCAPVPAQHQERLDYEQRDYCSAPAYKSGRLEMWSQAGGESSGFRWAKTETTVERPCAPARDLSGKDELCGMHMSRHCHPGTLARTTACENDPFFACPTEALSDYVAAAQISENLQAIFPPKTMEEQANSLAPLRQRAGVATFDEAVRLCRPGGDELVTVVQNSSTDVGIPSSLVVNEETKQHFWMSTACLDPDMKRRR